MATIKSYTDLEQSKVLAKILPLESADMLILNNVGRNGNIDGTNCTTIPKENLNPLAEVPEILPCWSLAALLGVLPQGYSLGKKKSNGKYYICMTCVKHDIIEYDNPIDACYGLIVHLHELNLL